MIELSSHVRCCLSATAGSSSSASPGTTLRNTAGRASSGTRRVSKWLAILIRHVQPVNPRVHMAYIDRVMADRFEVTIDGRKLFFPWGRLFHGYIVPSAEQYDRLKREWRMWVKFGWPLWVVYLPGGLIEFSTGSHWKASAVVCSLCVLYFVSYSLWVRIQCRDLKRC